MKKLLFFTLLVSVIFYCCDPVMKENGYVILSRPVLYDFDIGSEYELKNLKEAMASIKDLNIPTDKIVIFRLAGEIFISDSEDVLNHPDGDRIRITGQDLTPAIAITAVSIDGNNARITLKNSPPQDIKPGYVVRIRDVSGNDSINGAYEISQVTGNDVYVKSLCKFLQVDTGESGSVQFFRTILKYVGCNGIVVNAANKLNVLDNVAIVGNGFNGGIVISDNSSLNVSNNTYNIAVIDFDIGVNVINKSMIAINGACSNNNNSNGIQSTTDSTIYGKDINASNNGGSGIVGEFASFCIISGGCANNNSVNGILTTEASTIHADYFTTNYNGENGIRANTGSTISAPYSKANNNIKYGICSYSGSTIRADNSTANNNESGIVSYAGSEIWAINSTASHNIKDGFCAWENSELCVSNSTAEYNGYCGFNSISGSSIFAYGMDNNSSVETFSRYNTLGFRAITNSTITGNFNTKARGNSSFDMYANNLSTIICNMDSSYYFPESNGELEGGGSYILPY